MQELVIRDSLIHVILVILVSFYINSLIIYIYIYILAIEISKLEAKQCIDFIYNLN